LNDLRCVTRGVGDLRVGETQRASCFGGRRFIEVNVLASHRIEMTQLVDPRSQLPGEEQYTEAEGEDDLAHARCALVRKRTTGIR